MAVAGIALVALVLFARLPATPKFLAVVNDAAHAPVFALLSLQILALLSGLPEPWKTPLAFSLTIVVGIVVEWIQGLIGRDASFADVVTDALGALCALGLFAWWQAHTIRDARSSWKGRTGLVVALVAAGAVALPVAEAASAYARRASAFPVILRFETQLDVYFVSTQGVRAEQRSLPRPWGRDDDPRSLRLRVTGGEFPGLALVEPQADWRGYRLLHLDITNPDDEPLSVTLRVHDQSHNNRLTDRFNRTFVLAGRTREVMSVPLADVEAAPEGRKLDLSRIASLIVFAAGPGIRPGRTFYLTRAWLE